MTSDHTQHLGTASPPHRLAQDAEHGRSSGGASSTAARAVLEIRQVSKSYGSSKAAPPVLQDINLSLQEREVLGIVGPTGCGKTTLLKIIAGFEEADSGSLSYAGSPITEPGPERGFVFQQANLFPWLTVYDNVAFALQHGRGLLADSGDLDVRLRVTAYLERVGLAHAMHLYPYQISGGMKARAALGRVLVTEPSVLLMDEPFSALDALTRASMHQLLLGLLSENVSRQAILITHDVEEAILLCDRVVVMSSRPGRIQEEILVPFGRPRTYEDIEESSEMIYLKRQILKTLRPYLNSGIGGVPRNGG